jgi:hypothetical protein
MSITIEKQTAKRLYPESPDWFKSKLEEQFGVECFNEKDFESINSFDKACETLGIDPESVFNIKDLPDEIAYKKLKIIAKAINQGWVPNWNNRSEQKWFPIFNLSSGFGFSGSGYRYDYTTTGVGSRLCFESEEKSDFTANKFIDIYKDLLTLTY